MNIRDLSGNRTLIRFGTGDEVTVQAGDHGVRFLLISGAPIEEPVAWHGPIVMNTAERDPGRRWRICATAASSSRRIDGRLRPRRVLRTISQ